MQSEVSVLRRRTDRLPVMVAPNRILSDNFTVHSILLQMFHNLNKSKNFVPGLFARFTLSATP